MTDYNLNWLDIVIAVFLLLSLLQGIRTGMIRSVFTIAGIAAGLTVAVKYYAAGSELFLEAVAIPYIVSDVISFIMIFSAVALIVHYMGTTFASITRFSLFKAVDKVGGVATGLAVGLALVGVVLIILTAFPIFSAFPDHFAQSRFGPPIVETTQIVYEELTERLPLNLPRLSVHTEDLSAYFTESREYLEHGRLDFKSLDGATCFVCHAPVQFVGYLENGLGSISPKFVCSSCGRTSDGCQTYEGYHLMYDECPVILGQRGYRLDCGIWTNHSYHRPTGVCTYCGTQ